MLICWCFCASFCTLERAVSQFEKTAAQGHSMIPVGSPEFLGSDTRFGKAEDWIARIEKACGRPIVRGYPRRGADRTEARARSHGRSALHGQHPRQARRRDIGYRRNAGGKIPSSGRRTAASRGGVQRSAAGKFPESGGNVRQKIGLFPPAFAG